MFLISWTATQNTHTQKKKRKKEKERRKKKERKKKGIKKKEREESWDEGNKAEMSEINLRLKGRKKNEIGQRW